MTSGGMQQRALLPRTSSSDPSPSSQYFPTKKRRAKTACETCREHKLKCDGLRPKCQPCTKRGWKCHYIAAASETRLQALKRSNKALQSEKSPYQTLIEIMRSVPERDANDILARLRSGADIATLVNHVTDGDLLLQLSVAPESRFRYDFPYHKAMPASLLTDDNAYIRSPIYEPGSVYPAFVSVDLPQYPRSISGHESASHARRSTDEMIYMKPFHAAEVVDSRFTDLNVAAWTTVSSDNSLMRNLLRRWFHCEYHFTAAVQIDLFLEDLKELREDYCSSLLVNVMLGYACVCYPDLKDRAEYWNPRTLTYQFIAEAKRLWELDAHEPRITTIQAGMLFNVFYNLSGLDEVGQAYRLHAITLIQSMRLFSINAGLSPRDRWGRAYTAWAFFNWETLVGFSFMFAPLLSDPPEWPLANPVSESGWYGEVWIKYPGSDHLYPSYFAQVFETRSRFRIIMNEACQTAFSQNSVINLDEAYPLYERLRGWCDALPTPLQPKSIVLPGHLQIHLYYYHLVLTLFKPLVDTPIEHVPSPRQIVADATRYLQTLIRLYYLRHGYEAMDLFIVIPLMLSASDCVDALDAANAHTPLEELELLRSTLILVVMGLFSQRKNHYLANALFHVIRGRMRPADVALFRTAGNIDADVLYGKMDMAVAVRSHWPVSIVKKQEKEKQVLKTLVDNYAHLNIGNESS